MKELCVPVPDLGENQFADIELKVGTEKKKFFYRVVSFPWDVKDDLPEFDDELSLSLARISRLKKAIEKFDQDWELIQIFNPPENATHIQVLYRKK